MSTIHHLCIDLRGALNHFNPRPTPMAFSASGLGCFAVLFNTALVIAIVCVAWHFIAKFW